MALIVFYRRDWARIISGLLSSIRNRHISTSAERLAWLLIAATIPVGLVGLAFEHAIRTTLGRPWVAALFLTFNGVLLYAVEKLRNRSTAGAHRKGATAATTASATAHEHLEEDITGDVYLAAAGLVKLPELAGPEGNGILGQVFGGSLVAGVAAYLSLRFLTRYFHTHTLTPFAIYCTLAGLFSLAWLTLT